MLLLFGMYTYIKPTANFEYITHFGSKAHIRYYDGMEMDTNYVGVRMKLR